MKSMNIWNEHKWLFDKWYTVLYYIMRQFARLSSSSPLRLHKSFLAPRLVFISNFSFHSYSSRADTFLKASGTLYRFGSKLGVRGRASLFDFSVLLRFYPRILNSRAMRDYFWTFMESFTGSSLYTRGIHLNWSNWLKRRKKYLQVFE